MRKIFIFLIFLISFSAAYAQISHAKWEGKLKRRGGNNFTLFISTKVDSGYIHPFESASMNVWKDAGRQTQFHYYADSNWTVGTSWGPKETARVQTKRSKEPYSYELKKDSKKIKVKKGKIPFHADSIEIEKGINYNVDARIYKKAKYKIGISLAKVLPKTIFIDTVELTKRQIRKRDKQKRKIEKEALGAIKVPDSLRIAIYFEENGRQSSTVLNLNLPKKKQFKVIKTKQEKEDEPEMTTLQAKQGE